MFHQEPTPVSLNKKKNKQINKQSTYKTQDRGGASLGENKRMKFFYFITYLIDICFNLKIKGKQQ